MINSINITDIRRMCDKAGFKYDITESGCLMMLFNDDDYPHSVAILFDVDDNKWLTMVAAIVGIKISRNQMADALYKVNKINREYRFMQAFIDDEGRVKLSRQELIDEYVSEEWVYENFIKFMPTNVVKAFKEYFA